MAGDTQIASRGHLNLTDNFASASCLLLLLVSSIRTCLEVRTGEYRALLPQQLDTCFLNATVLAVVGADMDRVGSGRR